MSSRYLDRPTASLEHADSWLMVLRFAIDDRSEPVYERKPTTVVAVMLANLTETDWSISGRASGSRRTPTASVNRTGLRKLRAGTVYGLP